MKVVSVINCKGGVGKTTVTANLAAYVASQGKRVLMIDLDPQTSLTLSFIDKVKWEKEYAQNKTLRNFFDPILRDNSMPLLRDLIIPLNNVAPFLKPKGKKPGKMDIISSHLGLLDVDINLAFNLVAPNPVLAAAKFLKCYNYLRQGIDGVKEDYDLVLIDCPPNLSISVKNAITASDYFIVPARMDYLSVLGVEAVDRYVKEYVEEYENNMKLANDNSSLPVSAKMLGIIPTMVTIMSGEPISTLKVVMDYLKGKGYHLFRWLKENATVFAAAPATGIPVVLKAPNLKARLTWNGIKKELGELGQDFMDKAGIK